MLWFVTIFSCAVILLFLASIYMIKLRQRREVNSELDDKLTRMEKKWDPKFTFVVNLVGWVLAICVIYFVYL